MEAKRIEVLNPSELRAWRQRLNWSQEHLARRADVSMMTIWNAEQGRGLLLETYEKILCALQEGEREAGKTTESETAVKEDQHA